MIKIINNQPDLDVALNKIGQCNIIAIDTEFQRTRTYYPKLSIIQIAGDDLEIIIDGLSNLDISALKIILTEKNIIKILHASNQDLEIFYQLFKKSPVNVFDTQIAANICGLGAFMSYAKLCKHICNVDLDKDKQNADWLIRPLTPSMQEYAMNDVRYLRRIYEYLVKIIDIQNLQLRLTSEMSRIVDEHNFVPHDLDAWQRLEFNHNLPWLRNRIEIIAAFREEAARTINIPRQYVMRDNEIINLCYNLPKNFESLARIIEPRNQAIRRHKLSNKLLEICQAFREQS